MQNKSINEITLFRYLFNLDNRNLPQSMLSWFAKVGNDTDEAFGISADAIKNGTVEKMLKGPVKQSGFARLVK